MEKVDHAATGWNARFTLKLREIVSGIRAKDTVARNSIVWAFSVGAVAPVFGSLLTIIVMVSFVWNALLTAVGRFPLRLNRIAIAASIVPAAYAAVKLGSTIAHSGTRGWEYWPTVLVFLTPLVYLARIRKVDGHSLLDAFILGAGFSVVLAAPFALHGIMLGERVELLCGNPNVFAVMAALFGSLGALNILFGGPSRRWLGVLAFLAMVLCVYASGRRAMWIALPVLSVILIWVASWSLPRRSFRLGLAGLSVVMLIGIATVASPAFDRIGMFRTDLQQIQQSGDYDSSTGRRILMLKGGWNAVKAAPLTGYGKTDRMLALRSALPEQYRELVPYTHPHNGYLAAMLDAGVLGLIALLALLFTPVVLSVVSPRDEHWRLRLAVALILTTCYAFSGIVGIMFEHDLMDTAFIVVLIVIASSAARSLDRSGQTTGP